MSKILPRTYWDTYSIAYDKLVQYYSPHRTMVDRVADRLGVRNDRVYLDAGCGTGALVREIGDRRGATIYGIDHSILMLALAGRKMKGRRLETRLVTGSVCSRLPFRDQQFDGIAAVNVINYLEDPHLALSEFHRMLKEHGTAVIVHLKQKIDLCSPRPYFFELLRNDKINALKSLFPLMLVFWMNLPQMLKHKVTYYSRKQMERMLQRHGFRNVRSEDVYANQSILVQCQK